MNIGLRTVEERRNLRSLLIKEKVEENLKEIVKREDKIIDIINHFVEDLYGKSELKFYEYFDEMRSLGTNVKSILGVIEPKYLSSNEYMSIFKYLTSHFPFYIKSWYFNIKGIEFNYNPQPTITIEEVPCHFKLSDLGKMPGRQRKKLATLSKEIVIYQAEILKIHNVMSEFLDNISLSELKKYYKEIYDLIKGKSSS